MLYNYILFVRETVLVDGKVDRVESLSRSQYEKEVGEALFYREIHGNKVNHRIRIANSSLHGRYISSQSYGNGCRSEWQLFDMPSSVGWREKCIVSDAYKVEERNENGHDLVEFFAVEDDEIRSCTYDLTNRLWVG